MTEGRLAALLQISRFVAAFTMTPNIPCALRIVDRDSPLWHLLLPNAKRRACRSGCVGALGIFKLATDHRAICATTWTRDCPCWLGSNLHDFVVFFQFNCDEGVKSRFFSLREHFGGP